MSTSWKSTSYHNLSSSNLTSDVSGIFNKLFFGNSSYFQTVNITSTSSVNRIKKLSKHVNIVSTSLVNRTKNIGKHVNIVSTSLVNRTKNIGKHVNIVSTSLLYKTKNINKHVNIASNAAFNIIRNIGKYVNIASNSVVLFTKSKYIHIFIQINSTTNISVIYKKYILKLQGIVITLSGTFNKYVNLSSKMNNTYTLISSFVKNINIRGTFK